MDKLCQRFTCSELNFYLSRTIGHGCGAPCLLEFALAILQPFSWTPIRWSHFCEMSRHQVLISTISFLETVYYTIYIFLFCDMRVPCHKVFQFQDLAYI